MNQDNKIVKTTCTALDDILGVKFPVLDDGFIRVIDYMGDDASVVQAARVSYGNGTKTVNEDEGLIRYLMRNKHTSPFEMCELKIHVRIPLYVWGQWIRHRTANVNQVSLRYSEFDDKFQRTQSYDWRKQSTDNKQGSGDYITECDTDLSREEYNFLVQAGNLYKDRITNGVAREQARKDLPQSAYTEAYWKCDLHNIFNFLELRLDSHAQLEIRKYANVLFDIVGRSVPFSAKAFEDYRLETVTFTKLELEMNNSLCFSDGGLDISDFEYLVGIGMIKVDKVLSKSKFTQEFKEYLIKTNNHNRINETTYCEYFLNEYLNR